MIRHTPKLKARVHVISASGLIPVVGRSSEVESTEWFIVVRNSKLTATGKWNCPIDACTSLGICTFRNSWNPRYEILWSWVCSRFLPFVWIGLRVPRRFSPKSWGCIIVRRSHFTLWWQLASSPIIFSKFSISIYLFSSTVWDSEQLLGHTVVDLENRWYHPNYSQYLVSKCWPSTSFIPMT